MYSEQTGEILFLNICPMSPKLGVKNALSSCCMMICEGLKVVIETKK